MPRDRSISPQREARKRRRSRSASRDKDRGKDNDRDINRDRSRDRDRERSKDRERDRDRERSKDRERDRDRERSKDRERDRDQDRKRRRRDRSRSRHRRRSPRADSRDRRSKKDHKSRRSRSRSGDVVFVGEQKPQQQKSCPSDKDKSVVDLTSTDGDNKSNTEPNVQEVDGDMMMKLMGFGSFDSTKGKQVEDNDVGAKRVVGKKRKYRQYMNRAGGFNKPLDPSY